MCRVLDIRHCLIIVFTLFALISCGGKKGELRIKGEIAGLNNAELTVYSRDGVITGIDTLHVRQGKIDWRCPYDRERGSLTIVYPTYSTLTVFGGSGDVIVIDGDAKQLGATKVSGNEDNEAYTRLRASLSDAVTAESRDSLLKAFMTQNPESPVTRFLQLEELARQKPAAVRDGEVLPDFSLVTRAGDTITTDSLKGKYALLAFWANWRGGTSTMNIRIRRLLRQAKVGIECISYNMDVNMAILNHIERSDSIFWHSYGDRMAFQSDLVLRLGIRDVPYYVLADTASRIIASGSDWQKDIEPGLTEIISPSDEDGRTDD